MKGLKQTWQLQPTGRKSKKMGPFSGRIRSWEPKSRSKRHTPAIPVEAGSKSHQKQPQTTTATNSDIHAFWIHARNDVPLQIDHSGAVQIFIEEQPRDATHPGQ